MDEVEEKSDDAVPEYDSAAGRGCSTDFAVEEEEEESQPSLGVRAFFSFLNTFPIGNRSGESETVSIVEREFWERN